MNDLQGDGKSGWLASFDYKTAFKRGKKRVMPQKGNWSETGHRKKIPSSSEGTCWAVVFLQEIVFLLLIHGQLLSFYALSIIMT